MERAELLIQIGIFRLDIEAGTCLGNLRKVAVTDDSGMGIGLLQVLQEMPEGGYLLRGAGVGILAVLVHSSDIAYTDGMLVVVPDMCTCILLRSPRVDGTVLIDDPMVAAPCPSFGSVPAVDILDGYLLTDLGTGAMDNNPLYIEHSVHTIQLCTAIVPAMVVRMVMMIWMICFQVEGLIFIVW